MLYLISEHITNYKQPSDMKKIKNKWIKIKFWFRYEKLKMVSKNKIMVLSIKYIYYL